MPSSNLFAICNKGRVYTLRTDDGKWKELPYLGIEFKSVSAHDSVVWALGGDHQIYVYVYGTSVPIRVCEESFENQRWNPLDGFTSKLLPTDRPTYSCEDGLIPRYLNKIHLPSLAWKWEGDWYLQDTFEGKSLSKECWTYAIDFPRSYCAEKNWRSCVRRRKWVRYRCYIALDTWSAVSPVHRESSDEPFIDLAVGGGEIAGVDTDVLMVWAITVLGRVLVREGVCNSNPEGEKWTYVQTPPMQDVTALSIGRTGRVWALTWDGSILIRMGISRENPTGVSWSRIEAPGMPLRQISVGREVVWAVGRDTSIFFRKGLDQGSKDCHDNDSIGSSWMKMVGAFVMCSVGPNDQVWGIVSDDHSVVVRTGVTPSELPGKVWKILNLPIRRFDPERRWSAAEDDSLSASSSESSCPLSPSDDEAEVCQPCHKCDTDSQEAVSMNASPSTEGEMCSTSLGEPSRSSQPEENLEVKLGEERKVDSSHEKLDENQPVTLPENLESSMTSSVTSSSSVPNAMVNFIDPEYPLDDVRVEDILAQCNLDQKSPNLKIHSSSKSSNLDECLPSSVSSLVDRSTLLPHQSSTRETSPTSLYSDMTGLASGSGSLGQEEAPPLYSLPAVGDNFWMYVSGGGCWIQAYSMPKWFLSNYSSYFDCHDPWRTSILDQLTAKFEKQVKAFESYDEAVLCQKWIMNGRCRLSLSNGQLMPATLELHLSKTDKDRSSFLSIFYTAGSKKSLIIPCSSMVMCSVMVDLPARACVSLYTSSRPLKPVMLNFSAEKEAEDWLHHLHTASIASRGFGGKLDKGFCHMWAVTSCGSIYSMEKMETQSEQEERCVSTSCPDDALTLPVMHPVRKLFTPGSSVVVQGQVLDQADRFRIDLFTDESGDNVALHFNPRFKDKVVVVNSKRHGLWETAVFKALGGDLGRNKGFRVEIKCQDLHLQVFVNNIHFLSFPHRISPSDVSHVYVAGDIELSHLTFNTDNREQLTAHPWVGIGGHLRVVESGAEGVTWGLSYDHHVYVYTGALGGGLFAGSDCDSGLPPLHDVRHFHVWENERWNPLSGFSKRGLLTDRPTWSDQSGRVECSKESTKLPSRHWQWTGDWCIDHSAPGGADKQGWQYATDFPSSYHATCYVTDLVRRRRWIRKGRISTSGPWRQLENVVLKSLSIGWEELSPGGKIPLWAISASREVVYREGVSRSSPSGTRWVLVPSPEAMKSVTCGDEVVWCVSVTGVAFLRLGVTKANPKGLDWVAVTAPSSPIAQVECGGKDKVWALDANGALYIREKVQPLFPEGTSWRYLTRGIVSISASRSGDLWAVLESHPDEGDTHRGVIARLIQGRGPDDHDHVVGGVNWEFTVGTGWSHVSARNFR